MFGALARRMGATNQSIGRYLIAAMAIGFLLLLAAVLAAARVTQRNAEHTSWIEHTYQVELAVEQAQVMVEQAETTRRGYLLAHQPVYLDAYRDTARRIGPAIDRLDALIRDNPRQQLNVAEYRRRVADMVAVREHTIRLVRAGHGDEATTFFTGEAFYKRMRGIRATASAMAAEEQRLMGVRTEQLRRSVRTFYLVIGLAMALLALIAVVTSTVLIRFTRDLAASRDRLESFNEQLEEQVRERTADLTRANDEIQRFAYIVSHDLRSPLVNVMGFTAELERATTPLAELVDRAEAEAPQLVTEDAALAAREDLPEAIRFIRTSTAKMDRLINAILKLSREGRRVITAEPLDLADIARHAVAAIQHIIDERGVTVEVQGAMPPVTSDRLAVEQILSNLIENATKYLQPGRPGRISVVAFRERGRVIVSVIDNGRGIAPTDHQRIFDLFRRSGTQDQPGEGIGLAHVRALAYRLGGTIDVESTLGEGSTFRLSLPVTLQPGNAAA